MYRSYTGFNLWHYRGTKAIPEKWRKPIGSNISTVAIAGFEAPATLDVLTDSTVKMTKKVLSKYNLPVMIGPDKSTLPNQKQFLRPDKNELAKALESYPGAEGTIQIPNRF